MSVDESGSPSGHEAAWTFFDSGLSFMGSLSPAAFGAETSGREGRQRSGPDVEDDETGGPLAPFREHVGECDPFPFGNRFSKKIGGRMTPRGNDNRRAATLPKRAT